MNSVVSSMLNKPYQKALRLNQTDLWIQPESSSCVEEQKHEERYMLRSNNSSSVKLEEFYPKQPVKARNFKPLISKKKVRGRPKYLSKMHFYNRNSLKIKKDKIK